MKIMFSQDAEYNFLKKVPMVVSLKPFADILLKDKAYAGKNKTFLVNFLTHNL